jgi:O-antigen ligase
VIRVVGLSGIPAAIVAVIAYVSLVPFYYLAPLDFGPNLPPFSVARYAPAIVAAALLASTVWNNRGKQPEFRFPINRWIFATLIVGLLSLINAQHPFIGATKWVYYNLTGVVVTYCLFVSVRDSRSVHRLAGRLCCVFAMVVVYTCLCHLIGHDPIWGETQARNNPYYLGTDFRATAPFGNPISTGAYLLLCLPLLIWASRHSKTSAMRTTFAVVSAIGICTAVMTQSRGTWLGLCPLIAMVLWLARARLRSSTRDQGIIVAILIVLGIALASWLMKAAGSDGWLEAQVAKVRQRAMMVAPSQLRLTEPYRISQYLTTGNVLKAHPLLGVGLGNFTRVYDRYRHSSSPSRETHPARTTENMYLMFAAETGITGFACALGLLGAVGKNLWRLYRRLPRGPSRDLAIASLAAVVGLSINMLTWDALYDPSIRVLFWTIIGVGLALAKVTAKERA